MAGLSEEDIAFIKTYVEKTFHVAAQHADLYGQRSNRPYYPLNDGWGLTYLSTGQPFFVNTEDRNITPWILMGGHWETNVDRVLCAYAQPGMHVLDIGANMGYYAVKLGAKIGAGGTLIAFEPNPEVYDVCVENLKINGLTGFAKVLPLALGDTQGTATLTRSRSNMASANLIGDQDAGVSFPVEVETLDAYLGNAAPVDLIKLDAEGYESFILKGAARTLARSPACAIMIELGLDRWERHSTLDALVPLCGGNGRELYAVQDDGTLEHFTGDLRAFLQTKPFSENYFLVARPAEVERHVGELLC
ncbi:FkbM family methyltransferase [Novosphingobium aquimarinum]|uniref:FkbM family methyltransferase n=1 Tax=Novosphingobium aquimarinum TaxID=2682494 RepID=UPI0012EC0C46|nr:FkbM family methyltransferase [Novosphingobium aquimarinum]